MGYTLGINQGVIIALTWILLVCSRAPFDKGVPGISMGSAAGPMH